MTRVLPQSGSANLLRNKANGARKPDPLPRLLAHLIVRAGRAAEIERATSRPWASALFEGRRHVIRIRFRGDRAAERADAFPDGLDSVEFRLPGHFVADIQVDSSGQDADSPWVELSALTIADW